MNTVVGFIGLYIACVGSQDSWRFSFPGDDANHYANIRNCEIFENTTTVHDPEGKHGVDRSENRIGTYNSDPDNIGNSEISYNDYNSYNIHNGDNFDFENPTKKFVKNSYATCNAVKLTENMSLFPAGNPVNLLSIEFLNSNLSLIPTRVFDTCSNVTHLHMNNNFVKIIHPGAFNGLISLKELHLENNTIEKVSRGIFNSLSKLEALYLQANSISEIEEHAFTGLGSLKYLYINNNNLQRVWPTTLEQLGALEKIDFSNNCLQEFEINRISSLTHCDVSFNLLTSINLSIFSNSLTELKLKNNEINMVLLNANNKIKHMDLSHNNLKGLHNVGSALTYLNLSENTIEFLNTSTFSNAEKLQTLSLNYNLITALSMEFPGALVSLNYLYLAHNQIDVVMLGCFKNLNQLLKLDLSYNQLSDINYGTFTGVENLQQLDLSSNRLSHLPEGCLHQLHSLVELFLQSNQLTILDPRALKTNLKSLKRVQLEDNYWSCRLLSKLVTDLDSLGVYVLAGSKTTTTNIRGISCQSTKPVIEITPTVTDYERKVVTNTTKNFDDAMTLKDYFDAVFYSSNIYKFFEKLKIPNSSNDLEINFSQLLQNVSIIQKTLDENFVKSKFFEFFNHTLQHRIVAAFSLIDRDRDKSNSGRFQKVTKEDNESNFYKVINSTLQKIDSSMETIVRYFLENSTVCKCDSNPTATFDRISFHSSAKSLAEDTYATQFSNEFKSINSQMTTSVVFMVINSLTLITILTVLSLVYYSQIKMVNVSDRKQIRESSNHTNSKSAIELM